MARPCSSSRQNKRPIKLSEDRKSTRLNSSHSQLSYAVSCLKKTNGLTWLSTPTPTRRPTPRNSTPAQAAGMNTATMYVNNPTPVHSVIRQIPDHPLDLPSLE